MLSKISREPRGWPWQPNLGKKEPKLNRISCLDRIVRRRNIVNGSEDVFPILVLICGLIFFEQFPLFFPKIGKIAYTCAIVKMPNIQIGITSFVYKISTQSLRVL